METLQPGKKPRQGDQVEMKLRQRDRADLNPRLRRLGESESAAGTTGRPAFLQSISRKERRKRRSGNSRKMRIRWGLLSGANTAVS